MKLKIEEPCHENWDKMKIGMNYRHCEVCVKSVVDFTKMNRAEIITYMLSNPNDSVCGRMTKDQFDFRHEDIPILIETLKVQRPSNSFLILALVCMSLSSCAQEQPINTIPKNIQVPQIEHLTMGKMVKPANDTTEIVKVLMTDSVKSLKSEPDCVIEPGCMVEVGEVEMQGEIMMGDMEMEPPVIERGPGPLQFVEKMPEYNGGVDQMMKFIQKNLQYPEYEKTNNIQGNVYARFVVNPDGTISNIKILRSVPGSKNLDREVTRVINMMPK